MKKILPFILIVAFAVVAFSCKKDDPEPEPTENEILIDWVWDVMTDVYYWAEEVDRNLYPTEETDPKAFFESLLNEEDRFSWIADDYQELVNSFNNITLSNGISPYFFIWPPKSNEVVVAVEYVAHGSPADSAGIARGEIITDINGTALNIDNFASLFYSEVVTLTFADYIDGNLTPNGKEITLTAKVIEDNPVNHHEIIEYEGAKVGYIAYTGFSSGEEEKWVDSLDLVIAGFASEGITDLILDIRYNPGGYAYVANHIASMMVPENVIAGDNVFVRYEWNDAYQEYFVKEEGEESDYLVMLFEETPAYNLDLQEACILTGWHSASASEMIIIGLQPYMNITQVGENTYGKFYGSITIQDTEEPPRHNWALQPLVFKYTSSNGFSGTVDGLVPDIYINENPLLLRPFGDITDPTIAAALEKITGVSPLTKKSVPTPFDITRLPDPVKIAKMRTTLQPGDLELRNLN
jgi:C-terminal processing protease CtpA/Prc